MKLLLGCALLGFSIISNADDTLSMTVNPNQGSFVVKLAANPTTGFQWKVVQFDNNLLSLSNSQYQKPQTKLIGAGGQMVFTFNLKKGKIYPAKTNIVFKYARSWESKGGTMKKVTVNFVPTPMN